MRIRVLPVCASPALTFMYVVPHPEREGGGVQSTVCDQSCLPSSVFETGSLLYSHIRQAYQPWASGNSPVSASHATVSLRLQMCVATSGLTRLLGTWTGPHACLSRALSFEPSPCLTPAFFLNIGCVGSNWVPQAYVESILTASPPS